MSTCPSYERLVALWAGELDGAETATIGEHVFACDSCAAAMESVAKIVGALREKIPFVISHAHRDRLAAAGMRIHVTDVEPALGPTERKRAQFTPEVDLLVLALRGDVAKADRVDVEMASPTGEPRYVLENVPFDRNTGEVLIACQRHFEGMFPAGDPVFSVRVVEAGKRRVVGDYVVIHVWR
jgi:hypothetical protein